MLCYITLSHLMLYNMWVIVKKSSQKTCRSTVSRHITDRLPTANRQATDSFPKKKIVEKTRIKHDIERNISPLMLCYITCLMLLYDMCYLMLYNMYHVMLYNMFHVMLYLT